MRIRLIPASLALAALACGRVTSSPVDSVEAFTLQQASDSIPLPHGKIVRVGEVYLALSGVPSESRCPTDGVCVWAGDAVAAIVVHPPCYMAGCKAASFALALHTSTEPRSGEGWGHKVRLLALTPAPLSTRPTDQSRYVAWVRVTK